MEPWLNSVKALEASMWCM